MKPLSYGALGTKDCQCISASVDHGPPFAARGLNDATFARRAGCEGLRMQFGIHGPRAAVCGPRAQ